jgi:transposase
MGQAEQKVQMWLIWLVAVLVTMATPDPFGMDPNGTMDTSRAVSASTGVAVATEPSGELFPWLPNYRWRKLALKAYRRGRRLYRQARYRYWVACSLAKMAQRGVLSLAWLMDRLTKRQMRYYLGALPLLYTVLAELKVEETINRYCPTQSKLSHGTVVLVLALNRLHAPRAVWRVADWLGQTVLVQVLGVEAAKFKKDRLARSLDAIAPHTQEIWQAVVSRAIERYDIDLSVIYYDLTAFILHGEYQGSELVKYGFAHNTPSDKQKLKTGLNAAADGKVPLDYLGLAGDKADKATVEENMKRLAALLKKHGQPWHEVLVVGDRAMLDDRLALLYDEKGLRYLAGLAAQKKVHRQLLALTSEAELSRYPLDKQRGRYGHWGRPVSIFFEHAKQEVFHRGLVILSGPMRFARYRSRAQQFRALWPAFKQIQAKADAGQAHYRSPQQVQARAETQCRKSKVGRFVTVEAKQEGERLVLRWQVKVNQLRETMQQDGRYLIVTNDPTLSPTRMFELYRAKDGVEQDFRICKSLLKVSPLYLHKDERIQSMLLLNMLALLAYTVLERQARQSGLALTTRRIIEQLDSLAVIETHCVDGSRFYRLTPVNQKQADLIEALRTIFPAETEPLFLPAGPLSEPDLSPTHASQLTLEAVL